MSVRQALYAWRSDEASKRAVELFRVFPSSTLDEIAKSLPTTKEELIAIKGIKEAKYQLYGKTLLAIVAQYGGKHTEQTRSIQDITENMPRAGKSYLHEKQEEHVFSVGSYLDVVNNALWRLRASVKGEVTSFKFQGSALYFTLKDAQDESVMRIFMWNSDFEISGVELTEGMEVVVVGKSEIYKPSGGLSFKAESIELVGEGALKVAYETLKKKLELEGLFLEENKRVIPSLPQRIGLITSREGAVIHDFLNNLGRFGLQIRFVDSRVEGPLAPKQILSALHILSHEPLDALVLIRGGGSLESLQAFNNEHVVRAIASFPAPVICAIGHDKDVPLAQMVADYAPSTPTACTALINLSWEEARHFIQNQESTIFQHGLFALQSADRVLVDSRSLLREELSILQSIFQNASSSLSSCVFTLARSIDGYKTETTEIFRIAARQYRYHLDQLSEILSRFTKELKSRDPLRLLSLGYGVISQDGKILRSVNSVSQGDGFDVRLSDGTLKASVMEVTVKKQD